MTNTGGEQLTCELCGHSERLACSERGSVRSNVRAHAAESFLVWRCSRCASIHAYDAVDLAHYYHDYVFHSLAVDWRLRVMYDNLVKRLRRAGVKPGAHILDFGCGSGHLVRHLRARGSRAFGYDQYSRDFSDRGVLAGRYDCVLSQDVIEHVPSPNALLDQFGALTKPGGVIAIGTPNASAIDLARAQRFAHALHQPYHRHILSKQALLRAGDSRGWQLVDYFPTQFTNTRLPFMNFRFYLYYASLYDDTLDVLVERTRAWRLLLRLPVSLFWAVFGSFLVPETDVMVTFRRP